MLVDLGRSLVKIKKRRGPRTEPYGTPYATFKWLELDPVTETYCVIFKLHQKNQMLSACQERYRGHISCYQVNFL